jgi:recombination endonuclease VII
MTDAHIFHLFDDGKTCVKCRITKSPEEFCHDACRRDGRYPQCKECVRDYWIDRRRQEKAKRLAELAKERERAIANGTAFCCTGCGLAKLTKEFRRAANKPRGFNTRCRDCDLQQALARRDTEILSLTKVCSSCDIEKTRGNFARDRRAKDGISAHCRDCRQRYVKDWSARRRNGEDTSRRLVPMVRSFGVLDATFELMLDRQNCACAICGIEFERKRPNKKINIDHDHNSGSVRGLLCTPCNLGIGAFRDDPALLNKAIAYLRKYMSAS